MECFTCRLPSTLIVNGRAYCAYCDPDAVEAREIKWGQEQQKLEQRPD